MPRPSTTTNTAALALVLLVIPLAAKADGFSFKLEPGVAVPLTTPQSQIYDTGGGQSLKLLFGINPYLDIGPSASFLFLPASSALAESGVAWGFGGGLRLKRPHDDARIGISPWLDADLLYIRTGDLDRPGFDAAFGLSVPTGDSHTFWVGPYVRYQQTLQGERAGYDNRDAKIFLIGLSLEAGSGIKQRREPGQARVVTERVEVPVVKEVIVVKEVASCPDGDKDGVPDTLDRCPEIAGLIDTWGCPAYKNVVVQKDRLELKDKLYFALDKSVIKESSYPVLDDVALALKDNPGFKVQIEGHTDSSGSNDHNQALSEQRAEAVLDYLVRHDIAKDRLVSKGFASSVPLDTNKTAVGRENNRRVEFVVHFIIVSANGSSK
jgi:outer membrane protein OmpA-like peptidoglycan-associated protein